MRVRRNGVLVLLLALVLSGARLFAASSDFAEGNRLYEQGKYPEAIKVYENLLRSGWTSSAVFFNLGNAFFKNGELGRAIVHYRKAAELDPRDPDIQANLRFARERVSGTSSVTPGALHRAFSYLRLNEIAWIAMACLWAWLGLLSLVRYQPSLRLALRTAITISAILSVFALTFLVAAWRHSVTQNAIVLSSQAAIRLGPVPESQTAFTVSDGTEMKVLTRRAEWLHVADRADRTGWIKTNEVALSR